MGLYLDDTTYSISVHSSRRLGLQTKRNHKSLWPISLLRTRTCLAYVTSQTIHYYLWCNRGPPRMTFNPYLRHYYKMPKNLIIERCRILLSVRENNLKACALIIVIQVIRLDLGFEFRPFWYHLDRAHWWFSVYCRAMLCISATYAVVQCLSVCPSVWIAVCHVRVSYQNK